MALLTMSGCTNLNFGQAIDLLKQGKLVQRAGWNGKQMFIFMRPEDDLPITIISSIKSLPDNVKKYLVQVQYNNEILYSSDNTIKIKFTPYLCMKAADGSIVNGWLASQTDMTAEDWVEVTVID